MADAPETFSVALEEARKTRGIPSHELAAKNIGVPQQTYSRWVSGACPKRDHYPAIARFLDVASETFDEWSVVWWNGRNRRRKAGAFADGWEAAQRRQFIETFQTRWENEPVPDEVLVRVAREIHLGE